VPSLEYTAIAQCSAEAVWTVVERFGDIAAWHPGISASRLFSEEARVGSVRELHLPTGEVLTERLTLLEPKQRTVGYRMEVTPLPVENYEASVSVQPLSDTGACVITWRAGFDVLSGIDVGSMTTAVSNLLRDGHQGLEDYILSDQLYAEGFEGGPCITPVPLSKAYRLINHGPTVLVSARHGGCDNVMAAAWACGLDFEPPKVTVVIDKIAATRALIERSGYFALQVPTQHQLDLTHALGNISQSQDPDKLVHAGVELFEMPNSDVPLVKGCSAWLICKLISEPHNQETYDLFIGEVVGAWADSRVFQDGHWKYEQAPSGLRSIHYIAGGQFYAIGQAMNVKD